MGNVFYITYPVTTLCNFISIYKDYFFERNFLRVTWLKHRISIKGGKLNNVKKTREKNPHSMWQCLLFFTFNFLNLRFICSAKIKHKNAIDFLKISVPRIVSRCGPLNFNFYLCSQQNVLDLGNFSIFGFWLIYMLWDDLKAIWLLLDRFLSVT